MINTLLEHVPIKMEVKDLEEEKSKNRLKKGTAIVMPKNINMDEDDDDMVADDEDVDDDDYDDEDDDDDEEDDEEESDIETDALEIEKEATLLISSDEEAELEAQRIRFPDKTIAKKIRRDSLKSSRSSSRNSQISNHSQTQINKLPISKEVASKDTREEIDKKQRISPRLKSTEQEKTFVSLAKESNNNTNTLTQTKKKTENKENKQLEAGKFVENNKSAADTYNRNSGKFVENNKSAADTHNRNSENNRNKENIQKSPVSVPGGCDGAKSRRGSNNSTCSVASTVASDSAETESCGNIYVFNLQQKLIFNCEFCDLKYGELENFGRHLHEAHKLFNLDEDPEKENAPRNLRNRNNAQKNTGNIKKEPLQCLVSLSEPPVALPLSVLAEPLDSCGNVFVLNHRKLFLVCGYCECKYANLELFEKHLRQQHRIFEGCRNEVNVVPKVEVKEELFVITEMMDQQAILAPMVAIPAEIPLDISITPENVSQTQEALEEIKATEELNITEGLNADSTANTENCLSDKNTLQVAVAEESQNTPAKDITTDVHLLEPLAIEKPASPLKTRTKRRSSPDKLTTTVNKRPKRSTRNNKAEEELIPLVAEENTPDISAESAAPLTPAEETHKIIETVATAEAKDKRKSSRNTESQKATSVELKNTEETKKNTKTTESEKLTTVEPDEATNPPKCVETGITAVMETEEKRKLIKVIETTETKSSVDIIQTKEKRKSAKSKESTKSADEKVMEIRETKETRKSRKSIEAKELSNSVKTSDTKQSRKSAKALDLPVQDEGKTVSQKKTRKSEKLPDEKETSEPENEAEKTQIQCTRCDKTFARKESLRIHERVHTGEKPFVCDVCNKSFRAKQNLTLHKKFHLGESSRTFKCEQCDKKFWRNTDLKVHMRSHTGEKKFQCGICLQSYSSKVNVQNHIERDHLPADGVKGAPPRGKKKTGPNYKVLKEELKYQMKIIEELQNAKKEKESNATSMLTPQLPPIPQETVHYEEPEQNQHMQDLNADPVSDILEQIENEMRESEMLQHEQGNAQVSAVTFTINAVSESNEVLDNANISTTTIALKPSSNDDLLNSPQDVKPTFLQVIKRFVCDQCPRTFKKHIRLVEHQRLHTGEKPFGCDVCGKQFRIRMRLNEHKLRHSKEKKFKCDLCDLACCTKQDLNLHMRHHTNDRRFQCSMCPKAFVRSSDLKIHVRVHTGEKPYVCDICHKCFRANQNLSVHKKSHMGDASKTYQCEHCDKKFMRNIDRKVHMRSHTGEKPYKCEICQRGYSSKFNVRAHIERDHISANGVGAPPKGKKKPGPKPKGLKAELEKQKKLIEELQIQLLQQIKTDEKIINADEEILPHDNVQDCTVTGSTPLSPTNSNSNPDPIQSAYDLLKKLKTTTTSKPLTIIPSPPPLEEPPSNPFTKAKKAASTSSASSTLLPLTITQKIEQHSPAASSSSSTRSTASCLSTPSPPKTSTTKVVAQKTALGIQQVSVTVSMQVENVTAPNRTTPEKENAGVLTANTNGETSTTTAATTSVKKERKITSYFTVVGQKADA